jgi:hypothetical protein
MLRSTLLRRPRQRREFTGSETTKLAFATMIFTFFAVNAITNDAMSTSSSRERVRGCARETARLLRPTPTLSDLTKEARSPFSVPLAATEPTSLFYPDTTLSPAAEACGRPCGRRRSLRPRFP